MTATKVGKAERLRTIVAIEAILEKHCRPCDLNTGSMRHTKPECLACVHYKDLRELGDTLGRSETKEVLFSEEILKEAEKNGITYRQLLTRYNKGMPMKQIASKRVQVPHRWTPEEDRKLLELQEAGTDLREMTNILNRSFTPIQRRLQYLRNFK